MFSAKGELNRDALKTALQSLLVRVLVDDDGKRLFSDDEASQLDELDGADLAVIEVAAREHCGLNYRLSDAKKNLTITPT